MKDLLHFDIRAIRVRYDEITEPILIRGDETVGVSSVRLWLTNGTHFELTGHSDLVG